MWMKKMGVEVQARGVILWKFCGDNRAVSSFWEGEGEGLQFSEEFWDLHLSHVLFVFLL